MKLHKRWKTYLCLVLGLLLAGAGGSLLAQVDSVARQKAKADSMLQSAMELEMKKSIRQFQQKKNFSYSMELFSRIRACSNRANEYLERGIDTTFMAGQLNLLRAYYQQAVSGVLPRPDSLPAYRNLASTELLLGELLTRLDSRIKTLKRYHSEVNAFRSEMDSLTTDSIIYKLPSLNDSVLFQDYLSEILNIGFELAPTDSALNNTLQTLRSLEQKGAELRRDIQIGLKMCSKYRSDQVQRFFERELPSFAAAGPGGTSWPTALRNSWVKMRLHLWFYLYNNNGAFFLGLLLLLVTTGLSLLLRSNMRKNNLSNAALKDQAIFAFPVLSSFFIVLNLYQFFFRMPPFVIYGTMWMAAALIGTIIFYRQIRPSLRPVWLGFLALFLVVYAGNLLLQYFRGERAYLFGTALLSLVLATAVYLRHRKETSRSQLVLFLSGLLIVCASLSLLANISGRYNLSKLLLTSGVFGVMTGVLFYFTLQLLNNSLNLASASIGKSRTRLYTRFRKFAEEPPSSLQWLLMAGWGVLFLRNFYFYEVIGSEIRQFLLLERSIGNFSYTYGSILVFLTVLVVSVLLSRFIALFTSDEHLKPGAAKGGKKGGINNWLLLIRIAVITTGILLAFASAGIPMDKITIIIGSLGVGIGLGLQNIVGNLFSGIILAFERPFEIGDQIEVDNRRGKVKEMGFRSSKITTFEGSEVIIPNGDLLSHHVTNYTLSNNFTRVELVVGVKYGSDLARVKEVLEKMLAGQSQVHQHPAPLVLLHNFNESAVDFRLLFWTDINIWVELKSRIILAVDKAFREAGIEIPYPQLDVHIVTPAEIGKGTTN